MRISVSVYVALLAIFALPAEAKPKKVSNGCTLAQIQSPAAAGCLNQLERDIINGSATHHAVYCSSTGKILCCEYDNAGQTVPHSCTVVGRKAGVAGAGPGAGAGTLAE